MIMQKQLLITFDYELFLGNRSGNVDDCMIEPTRKLMAVMKKYGVRDVFFVDTTFLLRLRSMADTIRICAVDFRNVAGQLCDLVEDGHCVYPRIHPHSLDATNHEPRHQWSLKNTNNYISRNSAQNERR